MALAKPLYISTRWNDREQPATITELEPRLDAGSPSRVHLGVAAFCLQLSVRRHPFTWRVRWGRRRQFCRGGERRITQSGLTLFVVCRISASNGCLRPDLRPPRSQMSRTSVLSISGCIKTGSFTCRTCLGRRSDMLSFSESPKSTYGSEYYPELNSDRVRLRTTHKAKKLLTRAGVIADHAE